MPRVPVPGGGGPGMGRAAGRGIGGPSGGQPGLSGEKYFSIYNVVISAVLRIPLILMRIRIKVMNISSRFSDFCNRRFFNYCSFFGIFYVKIFDIFSLFDR